MPFFYRMIAKAFDFVVGGANHRQGDLPPQEEEFPIFKNKPDIGNACFDRDYAGAIRILRDRLDLKFPDGQYAHRRLRMSIPHNHAEDRAQAVDTMSTVVATALRNGASVKEAAEAGAASVGI
ncbi:hypothetical protein [Methylobacterium sp. D54C]